MIDAGGRKCALVVSSEVASRALPWDSAPQTAALFGDGAAAAVITPHRPQHKSSIKASLMRCYPSAYEASTLGAGGTRFDYHNDPVGFAQHSRFQMNGKELFRITSKHFTGFVDDLLAQAGWRHDMVDLVIPHQASPLALAHMIKQTGFAPDKVVNIAASFGNQIAASIPFALDHAHAHGRIARGDRILLLGTSAGVSLGGAALVF